MPKAINKVSVVVLVPLVTDLAIARIFENALACKRLRLSDVMCNGIGKSKAV
ncbi:hypothetical protein [Agarilytica rhodophyticola]|uniref:hypothetical protein n=1 Tax=Agarilytica rhodophyticola TaxID=1737490 RepID=UPI0013156575|nr:hypothetical protein [Agarilytica rhodophyticola]